MRLLTGLAVLGLSALALGMLRLAAEYRWRRPCAICAREADPCEEYCELHAGMFRAAAAETRCA